MDQPPSGTPASKPPVHARAGAGDHREMFWQNVMREILSSLAATAAASGGRVSASATGAATGASPEHELFDGRLAVITRLGQRIPIADVFPVFACSVNPALAGSGPSGAAKKSLAEDVQCTVFQIRTPAGEVFTLPVHEIACFHALSDQLLRRMAEAANRYGPAGDGATSASAPFGFAAFTSLARGEDAESD